MIAREQSYFRPARLAAEEPFVFAVDNVVLADKGPMRKVMK